MLAVKTKKNTKTWRKWKKAIKMVNLTFVLSLVLFILSCSKNRRFEKLSHSNHPALKQFYNMGFTDKTMEINNKRFHEFSFGKNLSYWNVFLCVEGSNLFYFFPEYMAQSAVLFDKTCKSEFVSIYNKGGGYFIKCESNSTFELNENKQIIYNAMFTESFPRFYADTVCLKYSFENGIVGVEHRPHFGRYKCEVDFFPDFKFSYFVDTNFHGL